MKCDEQGNLWFGGARLWYREVTPSVAPAPCNANGMNFATLGGLAKRWSAVWECFEGAAARESPCNIAGTDFTGTWFNFTAMEVRMPLFVVCCGDMRRRKPSGSTYYPAFPSNTAGLHACRRRVFRVLRDLCFQTCAETCTNKNNETNTECLAFLYKRDPANRYNGLCVLPGADLVNLPGEFVNNRTNAVWRQSNLYNVTESPQAASWETFFLQPCEGQPPPPMEDITDCSFLCMLHAHWLGASSPDLWPR